MLKRWIILVPALLLGGADSEVLAQDAGRHGDGSAPANSGSITNYAFMLKVYDPDRHLGDEVKIKVIGVKSGGMTEEIARDKGGAGDEDPGDRIFSALVNMATETELKLELSSGANRWDTTVSLEVRPGRPINVVLALGAPGQLKHTTLNKVFNLRRGNEVKPVLAISKKNRSASKAPSHTLFRTSQDGASAISSTDGSKSSPTGKQKGWLLQAVGFTALGFLLAVMMRLTRRREQRKALLDIDQETVEPVLPARLEEDQVPALLAGPLAAHRVVLLGPDLADPTDNIVRCLDSSTSPEELVRAVEAMAVRSGLPPALLVSNTEQLSSPITGSPANHLAQRVARRFPLYVVNGPSAWRTWDPKTS